MCLWTSIHINVNKSQGTLFYLCILLWRHNNLLVNDDLIGSVVLAAYLDVVSNRRKFVALHDASELVPALDPVE